MKDDDVLADSIRALRESTDGEPARGARSRTEILARAHANLRRRRRFTFVLVPLAAALLVGVAWGAVTGRLPLTHWLDLAVERSVPTPPSGAVPSELHAPPSSTSSFAPDVPAAPVFPPPASAQASASASAFSPSPPKTTSTSGASPNETPSASAAKSPAATPLPSATPLFEREQASYSAAHKAHFVDRDPAAALRGWDAYLSAFPKGRFATEALYNRAISLVRLGRRDEAVKALTPFADGTHGGYRRAEARELLDALASTEGVEQR